MEQRTERRARGNADRVRFSRVILPVVLAGIAILAVVLLLVLSFSPFSLSHPGQVSIISDLILILLALCPLVLCLLPLYLLLMAGIYYTNVGTRTGREGLRTAGENLSKVYDRVEETEKRFASKTIGIGSRLAFLSRIFDRPQADTAQEGKDQDE